MDSDIEDAGGSEVEGRKGFIRVPRTPKQYPDFGKGNCVCCGKKLPERKRKYCRDECKFEYIRETSEYHVLSWAEMRDKILKRDNYTCKDCGASKDAFLEVHHVNPIHKGGPEFDEKNLITLCIKCHDKRHKKKGRRVYLKPNEKKLETWI
jgi:5-methylcytosine-specific restriction endonuclease McrA